MNSNKGKLIIVSGFSGTGKSSIVTKLVEKYPNEYALSISATTRKIRSGEVENKSYFFITKEEFQNMINNNDLLEYASYVGNFYGTPKKFVNKKLDEGKNVILEIEIQGATKVKNNFPNCITVFVTTKDAKILYDRLIKRGTNTPDDLKNRVKRAIEEANGILMYDYILVNDSLDDSVEILHDIIKNGNEKYCLKNNINIIKSIQNEMRGILND